ncbi:MAG TPA: hypothetical protein VF642_12270 [Propionibacteriaceae bacterium]|jgi:hypothetical protein
MIFRSRKRTDAPRWRDVPKMLADVLAESRRTKSHVTNFNGKVSVEEIEALLEKLHAKQQAAARLGRQR